MRGGCRWVGRRSFEDKRYIKAWVGILTVWANTLSVLAEKKIKQQENCVKIRKNNTQQRFLFFSSSWIMVNKHEKVQHCLLKGSLQWKIHYYYNCMLKHLGTWIPFFLSHTFIGILLHIYMQANFNTASDLYNDYPFFYISIYSKLQHPWQYNIPRPVTVTSINHKPWPTLTSHFMLPSELPLFLMT